MPAYHSAQNEAALQYRQVGNLAVLPLKTKVRGPAPQPDNPDPSIPDIVDESLTLFRANSLFRNFEIYGAADRVLVYLILFISDCLTRISTHPNWTTSEAGKQLQSHAVDNFALPGEPGFPINQMYEKAGNRMDSDLMRQYLTQVRQECAARLVQSVYGEDGKPSKWWMSFQKRRFMNKSLGA